MTNPRYTEFYLKRKGEDEIREYNGHLYGLYYLSDKNGSGVNVWSCQESTIKAWGRRISEEEALRRLPQLRVMQAKMDHGVEWIRCSGASFYPFWTPELEKEQAVKYRCLQ